MEELKVGDMVWVNLKGPPNDYGYGEITEVWFEKKLNVQLFNFHCLVNGGLRMGRSDNLIKKPTARMTAKYAQSRKDFADFMKTKR